MFYSDIHFIRKYSALVIAALMLFLVVGKSSAQQTAASISGRIVDPQNASISEADVSVTNIDTNIARTVRSDATGHYQVLSLNPGRYSVSAKASGFQEKILTGIVLEIAQNATLDVSLSIGGKTDVVTVNASADVIDTETSSQGTVIDNQKVVELPLNQRTFYGLALLSPAAYLPAQNSSNGFRGGFNVSGQNETANTFTVNGIDDNDQYVMAPSFRPSVEDIQEFKLLTGAYSAEFGRSAGGQVVVVTKSGSNELHGDVFEFLRNSEFDARNYFALPGTAQTFRRNQFGATLGGPIAKGRTFYFLSYEGLRLAQPVVGQTSVLNPAFLNGDFSSVSTQLVNPATKQPYARNQIPSGQFSAFGQQLLKLYPKPNPGYLVSNSKPTYTFDEARIENLDEGSVRVDHKFTDKDSVLAQFNYFNDPSFEPSNSLCGSALIPGFGCTTNQISILAGINYTRIISDHWLNEFRAGWDRLEQPRIGEDVNDGFPSIPGAFGDPTISKSINGGAPSTSVSGYAGIHPYTNLPQHRYDNHYNLVNNTSWSHGKHNVKFGANLLQYRSALIFVNDGTGVFSFSASSSNGAETSGNAAADLLLGYASSSTRSPTAPEMQLAYTSYAGYIQDDWKITSSLTLNLGLRYEDFSPATDQRNVLANYVLPSVPGTPGSAIVAGVNGVGKTLYNDDQNNFAPRLGLAWRPFGNDKTVVHGFYGAFYSAPMIGNGALQGLGLNLPFRLTQGFTSATGSQVQLDTTPFPTGSKAQTGTQANPYTNASPTGIAPNFRNLYVNEYGAEIQRQITPALALTVGYLGNEGARLPRTISPNQGIVTASTATSVTSYKPLTTTAAGVALPPLGPVGANSLYYTLNSVSYYVTSGHSSYNALTVKAQQNYHNGLSFLVAETWGKSIDNAPVNGSQSSSTGPQNSLNLQAERGLSDYNVANRLVISPVYELPFGRGKRYFVQGIAGAVAGGWQISGIYTQESGRPFTINSSVNRSGSNGSDRPNLIGNPNSGPKTVAQWFNTAAFTANAYGQFGNAGRNIVIGPGYVDLDAAVQRTFKLSERYSAELRVESFDVANKPNFLNPLGTGTGEYIPTSSSNPANSNSAFGAITAANDPRSLQFSLKVKF